MTHSVNKFAGIIQRIRQRQLESHASSNVIEQSAPDASGINFDVDAPEEPTPAGEPTGADIGLDMPPATGGDAPPAPPSSPEYDPINGIFPDTPEDSSEALPTDTTDGELEEEAPDPLAEVLVPYLELLRKSASNKELISKHLSELAPTTVAMKAFIDTNRSSISLLDETVIVDAQKKIRKAKSAEEMISSLNEQLEKTKEFSEAVQRISSLGADRGNSWRQLLAVLTGGAIVPGSLGGELHIPLGSKKNGEVIILRPQSYMSWGYMDLGSVRITSDSASEYLGPDEAARLSNGSPGERRMLRGRVIIEAISDQLGGAPWFILVTNTGGDWFTVLMDSEMFREAYDSGRIVVVEPDPEASDLVGVDEDGNWIAASPWSLALVDEETSVIDPGTGARRFDAIEIAKIIDGRFILNGNQEDLVSLGADIKEHLWTGSPEELENLRTSIPTAREEIFGRR